MPRYVLMSYNIENMNRMFEDGAIKPEETGRADKIATVIKRVNPHLLGICEAANEVAEHDHFIQNYLPNSGYKVAKGRRRPYGQDLAFYYRDPFRVSGSVDDAFDEYRDWQTDLEKDGITEIHRWTRRPLEALYEIGAGGPRLRVIMVHAKSKGVFDAVDFFNFEKLSLANRKRLAGQALQLRSRLDELIQPQNAPPVVVMGDMNDGPGLDPLEKRVGRSLVETVMGSVYEPNAIFHNALWWMVEQGNKVWTVEFRDPIVKARKPHQVWIDHILLSPGMLDANSQLRLVSDSGRVETETPARDASDHFPVVCEIETD